MSDDKPQGPDFTQPGESGSAASGGTSGTGSRAGATSGKGRRTVEQARAAAGENGRPPRGQGSGRRGKVKMRDLTTGLAKARHALLKALTWLVLLLLGGAIAGAVGLFVAYQMVDIPEPNTDYQAQTTTVYYADGKRVLGTFEVQQRTNVPLSEVPRPVQQAVIATEDRTFWTNDGIDVKGVMRAAWNNINGDQIQGASTITQQYVKLMYLTQERTYSRKMKEMLIALKISNQESKGEILENYFNTVYFGHGVYGIEAAAEEYFGKDAHELTLPEGALLAGIINNPSAYDPRGSKENQQAALRRYREVLGNMVQTGTLTRPRARSLGRELPQLVDEESFNRYAGQRGYLMTLVEQQLKADGLDERMIYGGGLKVVTTFDRRKITLARQAIKDNWPYGAPKDLHIALSSVDPRNGELVSMIGGKDFLKSQYNWAYHGGQPGSAFKTFALAAAFKYGFTQDDLFNGDSPYIYPSGATGPANYDTSYGYIPLTTATANSVNTAFMDLTYSMNNGPRKIYDAALQAGIPPDGRTVGLRPNPLIALGTTPVSGIDMASSFGTFAANGQHVPWHCVRSVDGANGNRIFTADTEGERRFSKPVASNVTYDLEQVVEDGSGTAALELGRDAAGKTGTATAEKDGYEYVSSSWFVGYTPQLSTSVMMVRGAGNGNLEGLDTYYGGDHPTDIWTQYSSGALEGTPEMEFPDPLPLEGNLPDDSDYDPTTYEPTTTYDPTTTSETTSSETTESSTTTSSTTSSEPTSSEPTTSDPTTSEPTTSEPTTSEPTTSDPTTSDPTTSDPTTSDPTTSDPTTSEPTTSDPTTSEPTTSEPTTSEPSTSDPTTDNPGGGDGGGDGGDGGGSGGGGGGDSGGGGSGGGGSGDSTASSAAGRLERLFVG